MLTATWSEVRGAPVVSVVDSAGAVRETYTFRGDWQGAYDPITNGGFAPAGASLASTSLPIRTINGLLGDNPNNLKSIAVFGVDPGKTIRLVTVDKAGTPLTRSNYAPIYGTHAAYCTNVLRTYSSVSSDSSVKDCTDFLGLTKYCADHDSFVAVGYLPNGRAYLTCAPYSHPDSLLRGYDEIAQAIESAAVDAFVAIAPILGPGVEAIACSSGVIFACATLAIDVAAHAAGVENISSDVLDVANAASDCIDGDILACVKLGTRGASAAGVDIPGEDLVQAGKDGQACADGDFAACLRLGEQSAAAAGVPVDTLKQSAQEAEACYDGDFGACTSLGKHAAQLGVPLGGVPNAADNLNACKAGDIAACSQLGQALASVPR